MKYNTTFLLCLFLFIGSSTFSQNEDLLKAINHDLWANFSKAFETLDYQLFSDLHCENLTRVSGDSHKIKNKTEYIEVYKTYWQDKSLKQIISFRFLERICGTEKASERGIYKLTRNPNTANEKSYYGKFHVILKKEESVWKILVDYDSSEGNSINEESYQNAYDINDFESFNK